MIDMISVAPGFQYSVNIGYDIGSDDKIKNFIPTKSSIELLEDILLSTNPNSTDRARVLIGAYGKGKSHIVLTILSILMKRDLSLFTRLMPRVIENQRLYQLVQSYYEREDKLLPVVVSGSNTSLTQAFLIALQRTLSDYGLIAAMPETNYRAAVSVIRRWEKDFPNAFSSFIEEINEPVESFIDRLDNYDISAYEAFEKIYPTLTAGSVFNPFLGFDVVELYESVAKSIKPYGYSGIYVVFDEFSKYLESNITDASVSDTKMLQDFAEKCCRSATLQLHLMLISHKEISNYIDKLPKEKTDGWRGVSERFKHIHMNNNFSQTYEIMSSVIQHHEPKWSEFCSSHFADFDALFSRYRNHTMFIDAQGEIDIAIRGCFPLHPVSTFILPRLSERVAQNERTLFTFLSSEGSSTLPAFLNSYNNDFSLITPDQIYDYFEPLFKKEVYSGDIHDTFVLTRTILNHLSDGSLCSKIVKTISLIYILQQFERLSPSKEQITGIFSSSYEVSEIEKAITSLIEDEFVVYIKRSNDYLRLKKTSGVDIRQRINDLIEAQAGKVTAKSILNSSNIDSYMYPSRYNVEHEMTRYFAFQFISGSEVDADVNWELKSENIEADGVVYGIIPDSEAQLSELKKMLQLTSKGCSRCIFVMPKHFQDYNDTIHEFAAVLQLREQAADDPVLFDEYEVVYDDLQEIILGFISAYTHPEKNLSSYYYDGRILDITRKAGLTEVMSKICDNIYCMTPVINNESVNKNEITSVSQNSRNKVISALLRSELEPNLGLSGTGQDVSIMRSTLTRTGIWSENSGLPEINLNPTDDRMRNMLATIEGFILETRQCGRTSFAVLYERLVSPKHHIGLRYGIIPIYLAAVLHNYRQQTVISDRFGALQTSVDVLIQINSDPSGFWLEYLDWNQEKEEYISRLGASFSSYVVDAEKAGNSYDYVANAMHRWYMALPKYSKESTVHPSGEKLLRRQIEMIRLLRQNSSGSELLFKKLPQAFDYHDEYADVALEIIDAKNVFDGLLVELKQVLISETKEALLPVNDRNTQAKNSLTDVIRDWCEHLDPKSFEQLFPDGTDRFLQHLKTATNDEDLFISRLAKLATGLRIEDWDKNTPKQYMDALERFIKTAKDFHSSVVAETINDTSSYQITFADAEGSNTTRRFEKVDITARGKLLFNQINAALDAMGHAISEQEKRQILMEVLKKLC